MQGVWIFIPPPSPSPAGNLCTEIWEEGGVNCWRLFVSCVYTLSIIAVISDSPCTVAVSGQSGVIQTPGNPQYWPDTTCVATIETTVGKILRLTVSTTFGLINMIYTCPWNNGIQQVLTFSLYCCVVNPVYIVLRFNWQLNMLWLKISVKTSELWLACYLFMLTACWIFFCRICNIHVCSGWS